MAQGRVKDLESLFHRSEAELAAALSDKHVLENDVAELRAQLARVGPGQPPLWRWGTSSWRAGVGAVSWGGRGMPGCRRPADP